jgi:hypothetical protein
MQHEKTWTITKIREGEADEVTTGVTHSEALVAIHRAMHGNADDALIPAHASVHELPLAA